MEPEVKNSRTRGKNRCAQEITEVHEEDFSDNFMQQSGSISNKQATEEDLGEFFIGSSDMAIDDPNINHEEKRQ